MTPGKIKKKLETSFAARVFVLLTSGMIIAVVGLNFFLYKLQETRLEKQIKVQGKSLTRLLAHNAELGVFSGSVKMLKAPVEALLREPEVEEIRIYDEHFSPLLIQPDTLHNQSAPCRISTITDIPAPDKDIVIEGKNCFSFISPITIDISINPEEELYFEPNAKSTNKLIGYVSLALSKRQLLSAKRELVLQSIILVVCFLLITVPILYIVIKETTLPLRRLLGRIRETIPGGSEIKNDMELLDSTFDTLVAEVEEAFSTINQLREHLEQKVKERTIELEQSNRELQQSITQLQQTQMQLVQSEKMANLGLLTAGLGHEINNALNYISGAVVPLRELCLDISRKAEKGETVSKEEEKQLETLLGYTETGVKRISSFIQDLMSFARPDETEYKLIDINRELDTATRLLSLKRDGNIIIKTNFGPLEKFPALDNQLGQVFLNILLNAKQAIKDEGTITITTKSSEKDITITISDDGCGIEKEILPSIFDPFFTTKEPGKGTGLGLGICQTIIKKHGGEITVKSETGKGTTFTIRLPFSNNAALRSLSSS